MWRIIDSGGFYLPSSVDINFMLRRRYRRTPLAVLIYRCINYSYRVDPGLACIPARCSCSCNASAVGRFETADIAPFYRYGLVQGARSICVQFTTSWAVYSCSGPSAFSSTAKRLYCYPYKDTHKNLAWTKLNYYTRFILSPDYNSNLYSILFQFCFYTLI